jgi:hypothetical protein
MDFVIVDESYGIFSIPFHQQYVIQNHIETWHQFPPYNMVGKPPCRMSNSLRTSHEIASTTQFTRNHVHQI